MSLTPKQEKFCCVYIETGNASEAYRQSYSAGKMKTESINVNACKLLANTNVAQRVAELQAAAAKRHELTVDDLIKELEEARIAALTCENPQSSAAVGATMGKAKLLGLDKQVIEHTGPNGGPMETVTRVELVALK
jgi:phage terminase small subunit